jgi:hypothetical protein
MLTVENAIKVAGYFASHAVAAFDAMHADPVTDDARYLLEVIHRIGHQTISQRDLFTASSRSRFRLSRDLLPALTLLEEHGYIGALPAPTQRGPGRPPSPTWRVHPDLRTNR